MSAESALRPPSEETVFSIDAGSDRRVDIDAKMGRVAALLQGSGCEGLLLLEPENVAWLTSGAAARGVLDPDSSPAAYCTGEARWVLCANADSQRLFDEELDGLGFQLKEWPWHWGREQFLADLCANRKVACDRPLGDAVVVAETLRKLRRQLTPYEGACLLALGQVVTHSLEATCRTLSAHDTEREVAGQVAHRLMHRGVQPLHVGVAADGRSRTYRQFGFTSVPVQQFAVLTATGRKYGLTATASRTVCFGEVPAELRQDHNAVIRVSASYLASSWTDAVPREILLAGRRIYLISGYEHEWMLAPQGHLTGRSAVELTLTPRTGDLFQAGWAVTWCASAGAAVSCDTFLITDRGPKPITPTEVWPLKRVRVQGADCVRPDILQR